VLSNGLHGHDCHALLVNQVKSIENQFSFTMMTWPRGRSTVHTSDTHGTYTIQYDTHMRKMAKNKIGSLRGSWPLPVGFFPKHQGRIFGNIFYCVCRLCLCSPLSRSSVPTCPFMGTDAHTHTDWPPPVADC